MASINCDGGCFDRRSAFSVKVGKMMFKSPVGVTCDTYRSMPRFSGIFLAKSESISRIFPWRVSLPLSCLVQGPQCVEDFLWGHPYVKVFHLILVITSFFLHIVVTLRFRSTVSNLPFNQSSNRLSRVLQAEMFCSPLVPARIRWHISIEK